MVKRIFDLVVGSLAFCALALPLLVLAILARRTLGDPVIFRLKRLGLNGRVFTLYKFRSMVPLPEEGGGEVVDDTNRLNTFGRWLRASSLDELLELWNVLKGDMSLVGPRPLLTEYFPLYTPEQARRHEVRPGIPGWAQVNGRNAISWEEKFRLDVWYVDNHSF